MEEYLVYVEYIGSDLDGNYIYKLDFSTQPEVVWGESWNVMPAAICGHIPPDPNTIFKTAKMYSPEELYTADIRKILIRKNSMRTKSLE